jgi:hypothetical protein
MIAGMDKSFFGHSKYEPVRGSHMQAGQRLTQWPADKDPLDFTMNLTQAAISFPGSSSRTDHASIQAHCDHPNSQYLARKDISPTSTPSKIGEAYRNSVSERDIVLEPSTTRKQQKGKRLIQLSNAPQTKSQQQIHALLKLSKALSNELDGSESSPSVDLKQLGQRLLSQTKEGGGDDESLQQGSTSANAGTRTDHKNRVSMTRVEAMQAAQLLSSIIKQSPGSAYSQPRRAPQGSSNPTNPKVCECGHTVARACDMKKHMTRHKKPYGCTYPRCNKRFGAKSDWKRHEGSQHFQLEAYRCAQTTATGEICGEHFLRAGLFENHLDDCHKMSPEERGHEVKSHRIGKNYQQQFWCGFCEKIIALKEKRNAAWDERFDHIAHHFERDPKSIDDWVCVEENRKKGDLRQEKDRSRFDEGVEGDADADAADEMDDGALPHEAQIPLTSEVQSSAAESRKRQASTEGIASQRFKRHRATEVDQGQELEIYRHCVSSLGHLTCN